MRIVGHIVFSFDICMDKLTDLNEVTTNRPEYRQRVALIRSCELRTQEGLARELRTELKEHDRKFVVESNDGSPDGPNRGIS